MYRNRVKEFEYPEFEGLDLTGLQFMSATIPSVADEWFTGLIKQQPMDRDNVRSARLGGVFREYVSEWRGVDKVLCRVETLTPQDYLDVSPSEWDEEAARKRIAQAPLYLLGWYCVNVFPFITTSDEALRDEVRENDIVRDRRSFVNVMEFRLDKFERLSVRR